ncbi:uracil-DNA glycosylase, partial [Candidatus Aerophobetes bacterium]|nr:uracil-DNA glycosylase [Candidatus Aerophobetes bacterium]
MIKDDFYSEYLSIIKSFERYLEQMMGEKNFPDATFLLSKLCQQIENCQRCPLYKTRTNLVFGEGSQDAILMFVGEAPGKDEDLQGRPFVGAAGKLLRETIRNMQITDNKVYIANILKCRPPGNRNPEPEEIASCLPYLKEQIKIIQPKIICSLGKFSTQTLLNTTRGITFLRGQKFSLEGGTVLIPTYHPAACIYRPPWK